MISTNINEELQKYLDVLKGINPNIKPYRDGYMCTCPNTDAHNWKREKRPPTNNFQITIQKTNEENREKFGDEMVVYRCHAHGDGPCTNDVLAKIFKQHGIQVPKLSKKGLTPDLFPQGDDTYLNVNRLNERPHYKFKGLSGDTYVILTEQKDKKTNKIKLLPISYSRFATEHKDLNGKGGWIEVIAKELKKKYNTINIIKTNYFQFEGYEKIISKNELEFGYHGGEFETSLMLYLAKNYVKINKIKKNKLSPDYKSKNIIGYEKNIKKQWTTKEINKNGIIGNPLLANFEKGEELTNIALKTLKKIIQEFKLH